MDQVERTYFLAAMAEAAKLIRLTQTALQRARSQCHGDVYEHIDLMCTRAYELHVKSEWIQHVALGNVKITLEAIDPDSRQGPDRRRSVDRRISSMRQQLMPEEAALAGKANRTG
jgi:hypothetical protein